MTFDGGKADTKRLSSFRLTHTLCLALLYIFGCVYSFWPAQLLTLGFGSLDTSMGTFNEQITLKLSYSSQNTHSHLACCTGEVYTTKGQAMHLYALPFKPLHCLLYVDCVTSKTVKLRHNEHIPSFHTFHQLGEHWAFSR